MTTEEMKQEYGIRQRKLHYLEPHEMTAKELRQAIHDDLRQLDTWRRLEERTQFRLAALRAQSLKGMECIEGGGKTKPRKKICRIHEWDASTCRRIRGHKHDFRMPTYKEAPE